MAARGIALVPEGRRLFPSLTVEENLLIGGQLGRPGPVDACRASTRCFRCWRERRHAPSTSLSGGQQQMVAIGRALMANPRAAAVRRDQPRARADRGARHLRAAAGDRRAKALSLVIVEQDIVQALAAANHVYCLQEGRVVARRRGRHADARGDLGGLFRGVTTMEWVNIILQGVLVGGLYAMFAAGLSLIFGVMRLVNIAHGDLIVLAAYLALVVTETLGINPLASLAGRRAADGG